MSNKETEPIGKVENLKKKTITGFKWSFLENVGRFGGQFVVGIVLTRLLTPSDFGLVGMLTIFIVIGQSLTNSGFGQALIQKKNADHTDFSTVFYFNILASVLIYLVFVFGAPLIAKFYNEPRLIQLTKVICLSFVINAFGLVHTTYLEKKLDFRAPSLIGVTSVLIAGAISIVLALLGFGVWALVALTVLRSVITSILLWKVSKWKPLLKFSFHSLKGLFAYGSKILVAGLVESVFKNIYYLIIGRLFPARMLGYYTRASQFKDMPVNTLTAVVQKVTYSVFSTIQDEDEKLINGYTRAVRLLTAGAIPLMVFIFVTAKPLIHIVLGEKWLPVVPYLKLMSLYGWIYVVYTINNQIVSIKGRSDYYLEIQVIDKILIVVSILLTYKFGIMAMIYGHMVATVSNYIISSFFLNRVIDINLRYQLKNIFPFFISGTLMLLISLPLAHFLKNELQYLFASIIAGVGIYIGLLRIFRVEELSVAVNMVKRKVMAKV